MKTGKKAAKGTEGRSSIKQLRCSRRDRLEIGGCEADRVVGDAEKEKRRGGSSGRDGPGGAEEGTTAAVSVSMTNGMLRSGRPMPGLAARALSAKEVGRIAKWRLRKQARHPAAAEDLRLIGDAPQAARRRSPPSLPASFILTL